MSIKDNLINKLESQIDVWDKEIEATKADAEKKEAEAENEKAGARLKEGLMDTVHALGDRIDSAKKKITEIQEAGEDHLDELKSKINDWLK